MQEACEARNRSVGRNRKFRGHGRSTHLPGRPVPRNAAAAPQRGSEPLRQIERASGSPRWRNTGLLEAASMFKAMTPWSRRLSLAAIAAAAVPVFAQTNVVSTQLRPLTRCSSCLLRLGRRWSTCGGCACAGRLRA